MGYLILWIETLAVSLLGMAWVMACVGRWQRRWLRTLVWGAIALIMLLPYVVAVACLGALKFGIFPNYPWFYYAVTLGTAFLLGVIILWRCALKRGPIADIPTAAARWSRVSLFTVWCIAIALHVITVQSMDSQVIRQAEAIRDESKILLRSLVSVSVPEPENAAPLYQLAAEHFRCWTGNQQRWLEGRGTSFDSKDPELLQFMGEREAVVRLLQAATKRPACVFAVDPQEPGRTLFHPFENVVRELALFLTLHCRLELAQKNRPGAWQDVETLFRYAGHIRGAHELNFPFDAANIEKYAIQSLQYVFADAPPTTEELATLKIDEFFSWRRALREAIPALNASMLQAVTLLGVEQPGNLDAQGFQLIPIYRAFLANTAIYRIYFFPIDLAVYRRIARATETRLAWPYYDAKAFSEEDCTNAFDPRDLGAIATGESHVAQLLLLLPQICAKADARHGMAVVAVATARFQAKNGCFPEKLEELTPDFLTAIPLDPFDGQPVKYEKTAAGVAVYSAGRDVSDASQAYRHRSEEAKAEAAKAEKLSLTFELPLSHLP